VIGTLVQDLSDGVELEKAVRNFEGKVAPQNYRRPTALITKRMVDGAVKTIQELGLEAALQRRHARFSDVSINSVLFVDSSVQGEMMGGIAGILMEEVKPPPFDPKRGEEIGIDGFIAEVLPKTTSLRLYLDNAVLGNFVSMTAPVHTDTKSLFRWGNNFAWSYDGNVADSIKDKVKRAGGKVEGVTMRVSLGWHNTDDLDLHVWEPDGSHIYHGTKRVWCGGELDVDMNVGHSTLVRDAVENVRWVKQLRDGVYKIAVHQFNKRESIDVGFSVELESLIGLDTFNYSRALGSGMMQPVAEITVSGGAISKIVWAAGDGITRGTVSH
jgi:hypothetical protein